MAVRRYSKGMVQRLGVAQALVQDPDLVILDEPMSGLDPIGRRDVRALILSLRDEGKTVLFSSHILSDAETLCSRVAILAAGRLQALGSMTELVEFSVRAWEMLLDGTSAALETRLREAGATPDRCSRRAGSRRISPEPGARAVAATGKRRRRPRPGAAAGPRDARGRLPQARRGQAPRRARRGGGLTMGLVRAVALNTFREAVRDRVFYNLLLFAVLLVGASLVIGQLAAGQDVKIIKDLGLAASLLFGVGIAVFIGIQLVAREVERRSVHATLSKPVSRPMFLLGKYVGLLLTLGVNIIVMAVALFAVLAVYGRPDPAWRAGGLDRPGPRPTAARRPRAHLRRTGGRHGHCVAVLDVFVGVALGHVHVRASGWPVTSWATSARSIRSAHPAATAWVGLAGLVAAAQPRPVRRQGGSRARRAGAARAGPGGGGVRHRVQRGHVSLGDRDLPAAGLQVTRRLAWLIGAAVLLASAMELQAMSLRQRPQRELPAVLYLQTPAVARRVALSFDMLAADLYWMRALQHFGATRLRIDGPRTFENLYPFLDLATSLDPRFIVAYRFGAIFLSEAPPGRPGRADLAVRLAREGRRGHARSLAVPPGHRLRPLLVDRRLHEGRRCLLEGRRRAGRALVDASRWPR